MSEPVLVSLIVGASSILGGLAVFAAGRIFGGARKDRVDAEARIAALWQAWAQEQGERIEKQDERIADLESDVKALKADLEAERETNRRQASLLTQVIRWALLMRDVIVGLNADVPPAPPEVEAALTTLTA